MIKMKKTGGKFEKGEYDSPVRMNDAEKNDTIGANCILPQKMILPYKTIGAIACGLKGQKVVVALLDKKA